MHTSYSVILRALFLVGTGLGPMIFSVPAVSAPQCRLLFKSTQPPLFADFYKSPQAYSLGQDSLLDNRKKIDLSHLYILRESGQSERQKLLADFPLGNIVASPGHRYLRNPDQLEGLQQYIEQGAGNFSTDPILINIVTHNGRIQWIDLWNAHHRLVAYMMAGYQTLGQIPQENVIILVDGHTSLAQDQYKHFVSIGALSQETLQNFRHKIVNPGPGIRPGTVEFAGWHSNYELGSRNTLADTYANHTLKPVRTIRVGVLFGTFDPPHLGHLQLALNAAQELGLDQIFLLPNPNPTHKPNATSYSLRSQMVQLMANSHPELNALTGDWEFMVNAFGRDPLFEKIYQATGAQAVYQLIGTDSLNRLIEGEKESRLPFVHYFHINRTGYILNAIPDNWADRVAHGSKDITPEPISSTELRNSIWRDQSPGGEFLQPSVYEFILEHSLYNNQ